MYLHPHAFAFVRVSVFNFLLQRRFGSMHARETHASITDLAVCARELHPLEVELSTQVELVLESQ